MALSLQVLLVPSLLAIAATRATPPPTSCELPTRTLTTACNGMCSQERDACVMYESGKDCSNKTDVWGSCVGVNPDDGCAYECFSMETAIQDQSMLIHITGGKYKSRFERWSEVHDPNWKYKIENAGNAVVSTDDEYASPAINNDKVDVIGSINVPETVTSIYIKGRETDACVKGRVANVSITANLVPAYVNMVTLVSLKIGPQLEKSLTRYLPMTITDLDISNTMMTKLPGDMDEFTSIASLAADQNNITRIPASLSMASIHNLSMSENTMKSFDGYFPNMECLWLNNNSFTSIPPAIFAMKKLRLLSLEFNPLEKVTLNQTEFNFLNNLPELYISESLNAACASPVVLRDIGTGAKVDVCIQDHPARGTYSSDLTAPAKKTSVGMIVGVVIGVAAGIAIAGLVIWKRRRSSSSTLFITQSKSDTTRQAKSSEIAINSGILSNDPVLRMHRLEVDDIRDLRQLGAGAFGVVWLVTYRGMQSLASKRLKASDVNQDQIDKFLDEIRLTARLEHTNIVRFVGVAWTRLSDVQALYEYMENGDLRNWLKHTDASIGWRREKLQIAIETVEALVYVHSFSPPIVHRDLKSSNVLLDANMSAKLCDFGLARLQSTQQTMTIGVGTSSWLAPEVITGEGDYGFQADVYSFGVLLSELDTHCIPYEDARSDTGNRLPDIAILHQVGCGKLQPSFSDSCPAELKELGLRCLAHDPAMRPTAIEASFALFRAMASSF